MNLIMLSGRIARDIELRQTQTGKNYVRNSIAVRRSRKNAEGEYESDFFEFEAWNATAEYLATRAKKGGRIEIAGELQNNNYQKEDGSTVYGNRIVVNRLEIIDYSEENQQMQQPQQPYQPQQNMNGFQQPMQQPQQTYQPQMDNFSIPGANPIGSKDLPF